MSVLAGEAGSIEKVEWRFVNITEVTADDAADSELLFQQDLVHTLKLAKSDGRGTREAGVQVRQPTVYRLSPGDLTSPRPPGGYVVWAGFSGPVDAAPTVNQVNAGAGIPLKSSLAGDRGLNIFDTGYPKSQAASCQSLAGNPTDPIESTTSTPGGLTYDPTADQYSYLWKTDKAWAGTCRQLFLRFAGTVPDYSGGQVVFDFQLK